MNCFKVGCQRERGDGGVYCGPHAAGQTRSLAVKERQAITARNSWRGQVAAVMHAIEREHQDADRRWAILRTWAQNQDA